MLMKDNIGENIKLIDEGMGAYIWPINRSDAVPALQIQA